MARLEQDYIVVGSEIMSEEEIRRDFVTYRQLSFPDKLHCVKWLARRKLLHNIYKCIGCDTLMSLVKSADRTDGCQWRCKDCRKVATIRSNSFFQLSRLPLDKLIRMVYGWAMDTSQNQIMRDNEMRSKRTVIDWCSFCRSICEQFLIDNPITIGGLNEDCTAKVVEIDGSKFDRKYHGGQWREGHCLFGGIERGTGHCFLIEVPDTSMNTLPKVIKQYILPGTLIVSDGRKGYDDIGDIDGGGMYEHHILHNVGNFVDPNDRTIHIQNMKNLWMRAKKMLTRQMRTSEALFPSHLHEFMWRNKFKNSDAFAEFVICVGKQYPVQH